MELGPDFGASLPLLPEDDLSHRVGRSRDYNRNVAGAHE